MGKDAQRENLLNAFVRRRKGLLVFLACLVVWLIVMAAMQGGGSALFRLLRLYLVCVLIAGVVLGILKSFRDGVSGGLLGIMFLGFVTWVPGGHPNSSTCGHLKFLHP